MCRQSGQLRPSPAYLAPMSCCRTSYRLTMPTSFPSFRTRAAGLSRVSMAPSRSVGKCASTIGSGGVHHLAHRPIEQRRLASARVIRLLSSNAADGLAVLDHGNLTHVPGIHQAERLPHHGGRRHADQRRGPRGPAAEQLLHGGTGRVQQLVLPHPLVVEHLREVALAGVAEYGDDQRRRVVDLARDVERQRHVHARTSRRRASLPRARAGGP